MTTTTPLAAAPADVGPVPLRQLAWVAWRRNRSTVIGLGLLLTALATYLVVTGLRIRSAYDDLGTCVPPISDEGCRIQWDAFMNGYANRGLSGPLLILLPGIVGVVVGAPLIGRELESGVFRYSWTQGVGRTRWAITAIVPITLVTVTLMGALGALLSWRNVPMTETGAAQRLDSSSFPTTGVAVVGWTLFGIAVGVLAGLLWRRVVPAIASGFAIWFGFAFLASVLRPHLLTPLTTTADLPSGGLEVAEHWTKNGVQVSASEVADVLAKVGVQMRDDGFSAQVNQGDSPPPDPIVYLGEHGYHQVHIYQPDSRYWTFQWIELGWLLVLSIVLLGLTFWLVRRRSA